MLTTVLALIGKLEYIDVQRGEVCVGLIWRSLRLVSLYKSDIYIIEVGIYSESLPTSNLQFIISKIDIRGLVLEKCPPCRDLKQIDSYDRF